MIQHTLDRKRDQVVVTLQLDLGDAMAHVLDPTRTAAYRRRLREYLEHLEQNIWQALEVLGQETEVGEVKFFRDDRGYGFIRGYDQKDIFVHRRQIRADGFKTLKPHQRVRFKRSWGRETFEALDVEPLDAPADADE